MNRRVLSVALAGLSTAVLALTGCGNAKSGQPAASQSPTGGAYPVSLASPGGPVTLDKQPSHIVSLSPTGTEMLFAIGAGKQVTAVDDQSNYPPEAPKSDLSGFKPNIEAIAAKNPDLVVLSYDTNNLIAGLRKLKIPVYYAGAAATLDDSYTELTDLGRLTGHPTEAAKVVSRMKSDVDTIVKSVPARATAPTYYFELDQQFHSATSATFIGSVLGLLHLKNVADKAKDAAGGYPQLSAEYVVAANPDLVFLADTKCCQQTAATLAARPGMATVKAVKTHGVVPLDDDVASRWGPRIVDLMRAVAAAEAQVPAA